VSSSIAVSLRSVPHGLVPFPDAPPPRAPLSPYTTLFRSRRRRVHSRAGDDGGLARSTCGGRAGERPPAPDRRAAGPRRSGAGGRDRKSTRLNSSHQIISYAVFCLKKKNKARTDYSHVDS